MLSEQILKHIKCAKLLNWDDLAYEIIKLEQELFELKSDMTEEQVTLYKQMISAYELEKQRRLSKTSNSWKSPLVQSLEDLYNDIG